MITTLTGVVNAMPVRGRGWWGWLLMTSIAVFATGDRCTGSKGTPDAYAPWGVGDVATPVANGEHRYRWGPAPADEPCSWGGRDGRWSLSRRWLTIRNLVSRVRNYVAVAGCISSRGGVLDRRIFPIFRRICVPASREIRSAPHTKFRLRTPVPRAGMRSGRRPPPTGARRGWPRLRVTLVMGEVRSVSGRVRETRLSSKAHRGG